MNPSKRKGARGEWKARRVLEAAGYTVIKAGGSLGCFDLVALGAVDVRCVQVKCNHYASHVEREAMQARRPPAECHARDLALPRSRARPADRGAAMTRVVRLHRRPRWRRVLRAWTHYRQIRQAVPVLSRRACLQWVWFGIRQ